MKDIFRVSRMWRPRGELKKRYDVVVIGGGSHGLATAYYLAGEYEKSIADCAEVLKRNPQHFGALSGLGQIYFKLEDYARSLAWFRRALEVNPNMLGVEINIEGIEELLEDRHRRSI